MTNPLWEYALAIYALDDVPAACLELQDSFGLDVNLLLYAAWLAHTDQRLDLGHLAALEAHVSEWRETVIKPLRALRRTLKSYAPAAALRDDIKMLELRAEQEQHRMMYAFHQGSVALSGAPRPLRENLALLANFAVLEDAGGTSAVRRLADLLSP